MSFKERYDIRPTWNDIYWVVDESKLMGLTLFYCTDKHNAETAKNYLNSMEKHNYELQKENHRIKQIIKEAIENERTDLGKSVLKQLLEAIV